MALLTDLIIEIRENVKDAALSNLIRDESPDGASDGVNTRFKLYNFPVVSTSELVYVNGVLKNNPADYTINYNTGIITFVVAPANLANISVVYYFYWFADADYTIWLQGGSRTLSGITDPTQITDPLRSSLSKFAEYYFFKNRAQQYANRYASSTGGLSVDAKSVTNNFIKMSDQAWKDAVAMRDDYYKRQGQREAPASNIPFNFQMDNYTPPR